MAPGIPSAATDISRVRLWLRTGTVQTILVAGGVSVPELADAEGWHRTTVHRWLKGERAPRTAAAQRLAVVLDQILEEIDLAIPEAS